MAGMMLGIGIFMPVIYGVMGFVFGILMAEITTSSRAGSAASRLK